MSSSAEEVIKERIVCRGPVPFAEFMELALYWPHGGYYAQAHTQEHPGDYFTAPAAHPAFGALLSLQLEELWRLLGRPQRFTIMEQGADDGLLAQDILQYANHLEPRFQRAIRYVGTDRYQGDRSSSDGKSPYERVQAAGLPLRRSVGCVLSNELLDALPVHRVTVHRGSLREIYVGLEDRRFVEVVGEPSTPALSARLRDEGITLAEGQVAEVCLALGPWMEEVAASLQSGFVLTVDYGHTASDLYSPERAQGSLRCYYKHTLSGNPLVRVGEQDITAHVDFTAVMAAGERHGLASLGLKTQRTFLANLGLGVFHRRLAASGLSQQERDANRMGMLELARHGGMGEFKVLVQSKGVDDATITGLSGASPTWNKRLEELPLPLLDEGHLALMEARYPHTGWRWEE